MNKILSCFFTAQHGTPIHPKVSVTVENPSERVHKVMSAMAISFEERPAFKDERMEVGPHVIYVGDFPEKERLERVFEIVG